MNKIIKNLTYVLFANIINAISKFIFIILISKFLTNRELGEYTLALAVTAPITLLFNMKLRSFIISSDKLNYLKLKKIRNLTNIIAIVLVILISLLLYRKFLIIFILVTFLKILEMNGEFYQGFPNKEKIFDVPAKLMFIRTISVTIIFFIFIYETNSLILSLVAQSILQFTILMFEKRINMNLIEYKDYQNNQTYRLILLTIFPLGIVQALMSFAASIPKYLLDIYGDIKLIGIFSAIVYLITIVNLFMSTLNQTLLPYIKEQYNKNEVKFKQIINIYCNLLFLLISAVFVIGSYFFGEYLLYIIFNEEFIKYNYLLIMCSIIIFFNMSAWMYDSGLLITKKIKYQPIFLLVSLIITFIVGVILISKYMLFGAGITLLIFNFLNAFFKGFYFNTKKFRKGVEYH